MAAGLPSRLAQQLACPKCRTVVRLSDRAATCALCGCVASMRSGVWDFVGVGDYAESFGQQWARFSHTQLDSRNRTTISQDQFFRVTGWAPTDLEGQLILDGGCGAGRYSEVALNFGARLVAMDISEAAFTANANLGGRNEVIVTRGDLLQPPLAPGAFDKVFSIGVLQHTPDPLEAVRQLMQLVRPGGELIVWMYERRWYTGLLPKFLLRRLTQHLSSRAVSALSRLLVAAFTPVARLISHIRPKKLQRLLSTCLPIAAYWGALPLTNAQQVEWSLLDTHDWFTPAFDFPQRYQDVRCALQEAGASEVTRRSVPGLTISAIRRSEG